MQTTDTTHERFPIAGLRSQLNSFETWLSQTGSTPVTARIYRKGVERWLGEIEDDPDSPQAIQWLQWTASPSVKRSTGYALRSFQAFLNSSFAGAAQLWTPRRLPPASRPRPRDVSDSMIRDLCFAAKRLFGKETGFTVRIWIRWLAESGVRRSESQIGWEDIDWKRMSVIVNGKTGSRELPLGRKCLRRFLFLKRRGRSTPWTGGRGQKLAGGSMYNCFKRCCGSIDQSLRPHHLLHFCLTRLCRSSLGKNPLLVISLAGVSEVSTLRYYYTVSLREKRELLEEQNR
jgi:integrase